MFALLNFVWLALQFLLEPVLPPAPNGPASEVHSVYSLNVSSCPGYSLTSLSETLAGFTANLELAGPSCNAFGHDIPNLTLEVIYESDTRLHVNIHDANKTQFTIPPSVITLPPVPTAAYHGTSDLIFNHEPSPFAFWITRRSEPDAPPIFDTRLSSLPPTPIAPVITDDLSTALDGFPLVFEDQYLQLTSALPLGANIYGLGEVVASRGLRRDVGTNGGTGTIQTMWARDAADPTDENIYGAHPIYVEHRFNETTKRAQSHGVFLFSSAGSDILLLTPPMSPVSLIQYRLLGGTLDFYFFSGPSNQQVIEQYGALVGLPTWQPAWGFGFHLCRWGYPNLTVTREQVKNMREADIPLEVMWNDIDLYHALRDFTTDPVSYPADEMRMFIRELAANHQHYIPIVDAAVPITNNASDIYDPYTRGVELDIWVKNPDRSEFVGEVWPGHTVFADWFATNAQMYWTEALRNWSESGIEFSGIWLDMNEVASFCSGSCGSSGNPSLASSHFTERGVGAGGQSGVDLSSPPYAIHNGNGPLYVKTMATNATHAGGYAELDVHNMFGLMEEKVTHHAVQEILEKRPFLISRSTFSGSGKWSGHWLGDNWSSWAYMLYSIQGVLQFQIFQIPFVGPDTCGFVGDTTEELCNRWMQLSAFMPFYRNHNDKSSTSQEPYMWESVANASRTAINIRYSLLPYWYTLFANASMYGTPAVRALFWEFPDEPELFAIDKQYLVGHDLLITPVLTPGASTVDGTYCIFPGRGQTIWRDWYTHEVVNASAGTNTTLDAPLGHINVHIRDGSALLLHAQPAYTVAETRAGPYALLVAQAADGYAFGTAYVDDGETVPPTPNRTLTFVARAGALLIASRGDYRMEQKLESITVLGAATQIPSAVRVNGQEAIASQWEFVEDMEKLVISGVVLDLNEDIAITWV
ncbi:glycosyl hydrolases family 31-domain-containing protein [Amylocystis lapponica]|nr:glycosyl hydrolases family 31-domain-containing protein [Amylocystis lapponica]